MAIASLLAALLLAELAAQTLRPLRGAYPYPPHLERTPPERAVQGIEGPARFRSNRFGCRGPDPAGEALRLLVVGGSTAACLALDDSEAWPQLVMDRVNATRVDGPRLWVTNSGLPGRDSRHHLLHTQHLVPFIPELDYVLVYCGLNDARRWLNRTPFECADFESFDEWRKLADEAFAHCDARPTGAPLRERSALWRLVSQARRPRIRANRSSFEGLVAGIDPQERAARSRQFGALRVPQEKLQTLGPGLACYTSNLRAIVAHVRDSGAEPILMTQALRWPLLSAQERLELRARFADAEGRFVEPDQMVALVGRYNDAMRAVAREHDVVFLDLAERLQGSDLFYDGCHFTEHGSARVAEIVADFLIERIGSEAR